MNLINKLSWKCFQFFLFSRPLNAPFLVPRMTCHSSLILSIKDGIELLHKMILKGGINAHPRQAQL